MEQTKCQLSTKNTLKDHLSTKDDQYNMYNIAFINPLGF